MCCGLLVKVLEVALAEATDLEPQLKLINAGKEGLDDTHRDETFGKFKRQRTQEGSTVTVPTTQQLEAAGTAFHKFLKDGTNSPLRSFVTLLSTGGILYATQAADKTGPGVVGKHCRRREHREGSGQGSDWNFIKGWLKCVSAEGQQGVNKILGRGSVYAI